MALDPSESETVEFSVVREEAGTYDTVVGGLKRSFKVKAPKPFPQWITISAIAVIIAAIDASWYWRRR